MDRKRAESYLAASGAVPITVTRRDGVCAIHTGRAAHAGELVSTQWISEAQAIAVTREARRYAGDRPDGPTAANALARAAASQRATLTADHVAIERAGAAAEKVEHHLAALRRTGGLREFNREFSARRNEAREAGHGFMSYSTATARLRSAMVERLVGRDTIGPVGQLFENIFEQNLSGYVANAALPKCVNLKADATMAAMRATSAGDSLSVNDVVEHVRHLRPLLRWRAGSRWRGRHLRIPKS